MLNLEKDLESESSVSNVKTWSQTVLQILPVLLFQFADLTHPANSLLRLVSSGGFHEDCWKVSFLFHCGMKIKCQNPDAWGFGVLFSLQWNEIAGVLVCPHVLKWLLNSNRHYQEEDRCSLGISSLRPATCLARKHCQVGFASFKGHYSKDLLNLCTRKWERDTTENGKMDGRLRWMPWLDSLY